MWALARAGIAAPHSSYAQYAMGTAVARSDIRRGDLVFFDSFGAGASHVGLATSPTTAVSATSHGVMTHPIFDAYWGGHYVGARRLAASALGGDGEAPAHVVGALGLVEQRDREVLHRDRAVALVVDEQAVVARAVLARALAGLEHAPPGST